MKRAAMTGIYLGSGRLRGLSLSTAYPFPNIDQTMSASRHNDNRHHSISTAVRLTSLVAVFCILASLAAVREGRLLGFSLRQSGHGEQTEVISRTSEDSQVINTTVIGKDIIGFNGPVPLKIYISDNKVDSVTALPNKETPDFFKRAEPLLHSWDGLTIEQATAKKVDAVSGATFTSKAITGNFSVGISSVTQAPATDTLKEQEPLTLKHIAALLVVLAAALIPIFVKNKTYRLVQQLLNAGVLGFWTGTFLDYSVFIRTIANGIPLSLASLLTVILFVVAFIYPLFGRTGHYCAWVCPLGSLQELMSRLHLPKLHITPSSVKTLTTLRNILWCVLMICLWSGVLAYWTDYELFSAFIIDSASTTVLVVGGIFLLLSLVMMRPFCRFVCPVGSLLNHAEGKL